MMSTKSDILAELEKHRGEYISGQELADTLNISRTSVWKAVKALEEDGHLIEAAPNRGYRLSGGSDILSVEGIVSALSSGGPAQIEVLKTVDSTNNRAKLLALSGAPDGTLVVSEEQTAGRGRYGKKFFSPKGSGLYMSVLLRPEKGESSFQMLTVAAAVSVCEAMESIAGIKPEIKWVNDVYLSGKKVCGILTEAGTDLESGGIDSVIVGIGVNCTTLSEGFPEELRGLAGSIGLSGKTRNELCAGIYERLMTYRKDLSSAAVINKYRDRSMMYGREIGFIYGGENRRGTVFGINDAGNLLVKCENGEKLTLLGGEVTIGQDFSR